MHVGLGGKGALARVDIDEPCSAAPCFAGDQGRRIDHARGSENHDEIAPAGLVQSRLDLLHGLPEKHHVEAHSPAAGASWKHGEEALRVERSAACEHGLHAGYHLLTARARLAPAEQAAETVEVSVQLKHPGASCLLVEVVPVLGYERVQAAEFFELGEGVVGGVGPRPGEGVQDQAAYLPQALRLSGSQARKPRGRSYLGRVEPVPETPWVAEGRYATFRRDAGAGESNCVARPGQERGRSLRQLRSQGSSRPSSGGWAGRGAGALASSPATCGSGVIRPSRCTV